jgi:hypothetical protein
VTGVWRKLHSEDLCGLCFLHDQFKEDEMGGTSSPNGEDERI